MRRRSSRETASCRRNKPGPNSGSGLPHPLRYMTLPSIEKLAAGVNKMLGCRVKAASGADFRHLGRGTDMQIGVYGSGYLGTMVSACLADFGTPVSCCHPDSSRMVEMAQGNMPFFEKNLKEIIRRNVRSGRLAYSTDIESFARKTQVIFLAEDKPERLNDIAVRIARLAPKPPILQS